MDGEFSRHLGKRVAALRIARDLSRRELARRAGIDRQALSNLEDGESNPPLRTLVGIQRGLDLPSIELLLGGSFRYPSWQIATEESADQSDSEGPDLRLA